MNRPCSHPADETVVVIDFETTGMGPHNGARATEIAAVKVQGGEIVGHFQSLMRTDVPIPPFIEQLTGISNDMLRHAPPAEQVMAEALEFARGCPLVAHNAGFDRSFWQAEAARTEVDPDPAHARFACTVLLSRRLWPDAPNHRLSTLGEYCGLPRNGRAHRALSDAELTARVLLRLQATVAERFAEELAGRPVDHAVLCCLQQAAKDRLAKALQRGLRAA